MSRAGIGRKFMKDLFDKGISEQAALNAYGLTKVSYETISLLADYHRAKDLQGAQLLASALPRDLLPAYALFTSLVAARDHPTIATGRKLEPRLFQRYLKQGWSKLETTGVWSEGLSHSVDLSLIDFDSASSFRVTLSIKAFVVRLHPHQKVDVYCNGEPVFSKTITVGKKALDVKFVVKSVRDLSILIKTPDATSPYALGLSADRRHLGVFLNGIAIDRVPAP